MAKAERRARGKAKRPAGTRGKKAARSPKASRQGSSRTAATPKKAAAPRKGKSASAPRRKGSAGGKKSAPKTARRPSRSGPARSAPAAARGRSRGATAGPVWFRKSPPPTPTEIGEALQASAERAYQSTLSGLEGLGLEPEMFWHGDTVGWAPRFQQGEATAATIFLADENPHAVVGVTAREEASIRETLRKGHPALALLDATEVSGAARQVEVGIVAASERRAFLDLVRAKLIALDLV